MKVLLSFEACSLFQVVFIGMFLSTYLWGYMSDKYGRKTVRSFISDLIFTYPQISKASTFDRKSSICFLRLCFFKIHFLFHWSKLDPSLQRLSPVLGRSRNDGFEFFQQELKICLYFLQVVILASLGVFYYGLISAISPRYFWIVLLRGMVGFSMSGVVQG